MLNAHRESQMVGEELKHFRADDAVADDEVLDAAKGVVILAGFALLLIGLAAALA